MDNISTFSGSGPQGSGLDDYLKQRTTNRQNLNSSQNGAVTDYLGRYTGAINSQEPLSALSDRLGNDLNLPTLRKNAQTVNQTLSDIPYTYGAATRGFDVNANQLSRITGQKAAELAPTVTSANNAVSNAESELNKRVGYAQADQAKSLLPVQAEGSFLTDRLNRESSGFNSDNEAELSALLQKMSTGVQLSEGEKNRAQQLSVAKMNYDQSAYQFNNVSANIKYTTDANTANNRQQNLLSLASKF